MTMALTITRVLSEETPRPESIRACGDAAGAPTTCYASECDDRGDPVAVDARRAAVRGARRVASRGLGASAARLCGTGGLESGSERARFSTANRSEWRRIWR